MNLEATVVVFDSVTKRKEFLNQRIEVGEDALKHLVGDERKETLVENILYRNELAWITQFQLDLIRALYNGGK